mmetsp:Transcript_10802/g.27165  ORF Transcript_10802/g.27165 Transcript_10802/m.27165 type:complete len:213 (-) Transcript_10802:671-1309(-)
MKNNKAMTSLQVLRNVRVSELPTGLHRAQQHAGNVLRVVHSQVVASLDRAVIVEHAEPFHHPLHSCDTIPREEVLIEYVLQVDEAPHVGRGIDLTYLALLWDLALQVPVPARYERNFPRKKPFGSKKFMEIIQHLVERNRSRLGVEFPAVEQFDRSNPFVEPCFFVERLPVQNDHRKLDDLIPSFEVEHGQVIKIGRLRGTVGTVEKNFLGR